jgi:hypothetical protein
MGRATQRQIEYIEILLDKINADIDDYGFETINDVMFEDAGELIDELKDDVTFQDAWDN